MVLYHKLNQQAKNDGGNNMMNWNNKKKGSSGNVTYTRMMVAVDVKSNIQGNNTVTFLFGNEINNTFFNANVNYRDNGAFGKFILIHEYISK